ncbi:hypothetical protein Cpir12675_000172 [Ceratocystis pirilliformis]|uniref:Uncharacterized protein n=1 Tax=Ceratocystis pirilliformis TaxID=259994 RepID=A0ABR3ZMZ6_9PEZI
MNQPSTLSNHTDTDISDTPPVLRCCCGLIECKFLKNNCAILQNVENDMRAAAALGQALLHRHETYMADAERDRLKLVARIEELQNDKIELEVCNEKTQKENKGLMNQIDMLNTSVQDADMRIMQLEANLLSSEQTVRRLENATARAADMERQIAVLENEQDTLRHTVGKTEAESRDTMQRWRRAERSIIILQEQMDRMEQEGKEERERHAEIIKRIERQREVERGLSTAAGRLKGAAAAKSLVSTAEDIVGENPANTVVSHFVRDLLADNAHLQLGMTELRELLINSHDEIQALREQLLSHQPLRQPSTPSVVTPFPENDESVTSPTESQSSDRGPSEQVHVHHHYHVAATSKRTATKPKKKRNSLVPGSYNSPAFATVGGVTCLPLTTPSHSPNPSISLGDGDAQTTESFNCIPDAAVRESRKRDSINTAASTRRDSIFSERPSIYSPTSIPSSPTSSRHVSMLSAYPADDNEVTSPSSRKHRKRISDMSAHFAVPNHAAGIHAIAEEDDGRINKGIQRRVTSLSIAEELAGLDDEAEFEFCEDDDDGDDDKTRDVVAPLRSLRRHVSHESIMSLSGGLDIHTLKARPSQLTLRPLGTASAVITDVVAQSTISFQSGSDIRSSLAGFVGGDSGVTVKVTADDSSDVTSVNSSSISNVSNSENKPGSVVRGWSKWVPWAGYSSTASAASTSASAATSVSTSFSSTSTLASDSAAVVTPKQTPIKRANTSVGEIQQPSSSLLFFRNSGVNQPGPLPRYRVSGRGRGTAAQALVDSLKNNV